MKIYKLIPFFFLFFPSLVQAADTIEIFPLDKYTQELNNFFNPNSPDYNRPLIRNKVINERVHLYKYHLYGKLSPWSESFVKNIIDRETEENIQSSITKSFNKYRNNCDTNSPISFGENFRPYKCSWFDKNILNKLKLSQFNPPIHYHSKNRAIAISNILSRALPTNDPLFYSYKLAGQGYPFDNLQLSSIWIGNPLYVIGQSHDKSWSFVLSASGFMAWVPSEKIAFVTSSFIKSYIQNVKSFGLRIITKTHAKIVNNSNVFISQGYIGTILPGNSNQKNSFYFPKRNMYGYAYLSKGFVLKNNAEKFPLLISPKNFKKVIQELIGRPYGWGGKLFYNDCSQELQSIFTTFGIWLPRNSSFQVKEGVIQDLSDKSTEDRIASLSQNAQKLVTLVYIQGHIMLYVGNYSYNSIIAPVVYNNLWGLRPQDNSFRSIIGQSSFFPILQIYPENPSLISVAANPERKVFQLSFLNEIPENRTLKSSDDKKNKPRSDHQYYFIPAEDLP